MFFPLCWVIIVFVNHHSSQLLTKHEYYERYFIALVQDFDARLMTYS